MQTLVIIDMQPYFIDNMKYKSDKVTLCNNICKLARYFKKLERAIIVVNYFLDDSDTTSYKKKCLESSINRVLEGYNRVTYTEKKQDSGAEDINWIVKEKKLHRDFIITGVNTSFCVKETIRDLNKHPKNICTLVDDASTNVYFNDLDMIDEQIKHNLYPDCYATITQEVINGVTPYRCYGKNNLLSNNKSLE